MQRLAEIPFPEVSRLAGSGRSLVILPVGVVEEHGAHLPLGSILLLPKRTRKRRRLISKRRVTRLC